MIENRVRELIEKPINDMGILIDSIEYIKEGNNNFLKIVIDRDRIIDIDTVVDVTRVVNDILDNEDIISDSYILDISSKVIIMNKKQMKEFMNAVDAIVSEKGIDKNVIIEAMEQAMAAAYKKKGGPARCEVNPDTGEIKLFSVRTVVDDEDFYDAKGQISLSEAKKRCPDILVGETIEDAVEMTDFGRVAAGTAKQVVVQRVKESQFLIISLKNHNDI